MMPACAGLLERRRLRRKLLKFAFNAKKIRTQVVLVCLQPLRHSSLLKCALQPKIAKNFIKTSFW